MKKAALFIALLTVGSLAIGGCGNSTINGDVVEDVTLSESDESDDSENVIEGTLSDTDTKESTETEKNERDLESLPNLHEMDCASDDEVTMLFTGDIGQAEGTPITNYFDSVGEDLSQCISNDTLDVMRSADILTVNNEFTYSTRGTAIPDKNYTFRANPSRAHILTDMGADLVGVANNHIFDYQEDAFFDTLDTIKDLGLPYVGAGKDIDEATTPVYFKANDKIIAVCAATQVERSTTETQWATEDRCGVVKCLDDTIFCEEIKEANENADYVIVFVHWGLEGSEYYAEDQVALAEDFVDAGADAIIGGHPHVLQGISYIDDVPVIYSLGNFWFNTYARDTGMAKLIINDEGIKMQFIPCGTGDCRTWLPEGDDKARIINYMQSISSGVKLDEDGYVSKS